MRMICPGCNEPLDGGSIKNGELSGFGGVCGNCSSSRTSKEDMLTESHYEMREGERHDDYLKNICEASIVMSLDVGSIARVMSYECVENGYEIAAIELIDGDGSRKYRYIKDFRDNSIVLSPLNEMLKELEEEYDCDVCRCYTKNKKDFFDFFDECDEKWKKIEVSIKFWS